MPGEYVLCEYEFVKEEFGKFQEVMDSARNALLAKAKDNWPSLSYGGMYARSGQFSESTIMPQLFANMAATPLITWKQWLTATGHQTILQGAIGAGIGGGGTIAEDYKVALVGLAFLDKAVRVSEIRMQIGDHKLPRINIEEAQVYNKPALIFENYFLLNEEEGFELYAWVRTQGPQRIKLIGLQVNRVPNKLQVSNTGAALL